MQPAELGWGTHEKWAPANAGFHKDGCGAAIYLDQPGANTRVRSWTPTAQAQFGFLVTHNESISIADYYTVRDDKGEAIYRPTCHYAYHPCDDAVLSLHELFGRAGEDAAGASHPRRSRDRRRHRRTRRAALRPRAQRLLVRLAASVEETRAIAPYQNATGMQVTSAVLAGMVWALENPNAGIVEADEMDYRRCLEVQTPYLGPVIGVYTDWTPLTDRPACSPRTSTRATPGSSATCWCGEGGGQGFCVNLSVDTSSLDIMRFCREIGALYIDTVVEPWPGFYFDTARGNASRTNYALRETVQAERRANPGGSTAISCCGANPGMVSWLVKQALINLAADLGDQADAPKTREDWGRLAQRLGVKGVHIAERDTQRAKQPKPRNVFVNTWSVEGFLSEGMQPAELGWGTHEKWTPSNAGFQKEGGGAAIYLEQPGANTRVRSWTPMAQGQFGFLVTHNESISIADYYTLRNDQGEAIYRPTCHYAYHPCDDAVL